MIRFKGGFVTKVLFTDSDCFAVFGSWQDNFSSLEDLKSSTDIEIFQVNALEAAKLAPEDLIIKVRKYSSFPLVGFACLTDDGFPLANHLNEVYAQRAFPELKGRELVRSKVRLYDHLKSRSLPTVGYFVTHDLQDTATISRLVQDNIKTASLIVKPGVGEDSDGVYRSKPGESLSETIEGYKATLKRVNLYKRDYLNGPHMFMEYIECRNRPIEVIVDGFFCDSRASVFTVGEKVRVREYEPFFDTLIVSPPANKVIRSRADELRSVTEEVIRSIDVKRCLFHFEFRLSDNGVVPIDCSLRVGGGYIPHMVNELTGVDLRFLALNEFFNPRDIPHYPVSPEKACAIGVSYAYDIESVACYELVEELSKSPLVVGYHLSQSFSKDTLCRQDAKLSLAVRGDTPQQAQENFLQIIKRHGLALLSCD